MVKVVKKELTVKNIDQYYYEVKQKNKEEVLSRLLDMYNPKRSLVFCNTKRRVDELTADLKGRGYFAEGLHGDLKQSQRPGHEWFPQWEDRDTDCHGCGSQGN